MRHIKTFSFFAAAMMLACLATTALAADANGTWKWKFTPPNGGEERELTLTLKQDGEKLSGTLAFGEQFSTEIKNGSFKNDEVKFETVFERNGNSFTTKYSGKVDGDAIKGQTERERNGEVVKRDWEAKRQK